MSGWNQYPMKSMRMSMNNNHIIIHYETSEILAIGCADSICGIGLFTKQWKKDNGKEKSIGSVFLGNGNNKASGKAICCDRCASI